MSLSKPAVVLRIFLPFAAGYFLSYLYRTINAVLSPYLAAELRLDATDLGLLTSVYFLTFAAFQLPLGVLLDRFGPRRVEAMLLLFAAVGAGICAASSNSAELVVGRGLIGLGVSACLMASFKAFVMWFPAARLPVANGWVLAAGGLGALAATAPVEAALKLTDWRGLFAGLAGLSVVLALGLLMAVPERGGGGPAAGDWRSQACGVADIFCSRVFWWIAPSSVLSQASFLAIQGLWAGPWLRDVAGLNNTVAADYLFWIAAGMVGGFLGMGQLAYRLSRRGVPPVAVAAGGMGLFMLMQLAILVVPGMLPPWVLFGFFGTTGMLNYAILSQAFPPALAGRANTALNLLVFVLAFAGQWGMGAIINHWPADGGYAAAGYQLAFGLALAGQFMTWAWLLFGSTWAHPADQS